MKGWMGLVCYEQAGSCPQWPPTHCACSSCSPVVTSPHLDTQPQPCPTSSQTRPATASPSPRLSTSASCWPSCCGWPGSPVSLSSVQQREEFDSLGFQAAVSMGPISTCQSLSVVSMLQVSLTKLSRSEIIPVFSSRLSTNLVSQQKIRRGKIPLRLFQSKGLDSSVASDEHPRRVWPCGCPG